MVRLLLPLELVIGIFFVVVVVEVLLSFSLFYLVQYILVLCINKNNSLVLLSTSDAIHSRILGIRFYYLRSAMLVIIRPVNEL